MQTIQEQSRILPVSTEADVIVCGGGPAGVAAAVASARSGAKTTLIEAHGCLGGIWTAGCLSWIIDHKNKSGLMQEILIQLEAMDGRAIWDGAPTNAFDGFIGHGALWNVALSDAEIASLANPGVSPLRMRRDSLVAYWPLNGQSPEIDIVGRKDLTLFGAPTVAEEPPNSWSIIAPG